VPYSRASWESTRPSCLPLGAAPCGTLSPLNLSQGPRLRKRLWIEVYHDDDTRQGDFFLAIGWVLSQEEEPWGAERD
jgi:hypothetical protein